MVNRDLMEVTGGGNSLRRWRWWSRPDWKNHDGIIITEVQDLTFYYLTLLPDHLPRIFWRRWRRLLLVDFGGKD
jgi:hypothetical protein